MNKIIKILLPTLLLYLFCNISSANEFIILGGSASKQLTKSIANKLNIPVGNANISNFNDGEINIKIENSVRNKDVYIIQSIAKSDHATINDNLMELYLLIRTLKRASAGKITAVIPYYGYARQDRKSDSRVPISASDVAMLLESSGVDRIVALDLHAGQIQGFFHNVPVDNIYGSIFMTPIFAELKLHNPVVISPDAGGVARAKKFRDTLALYGVNADFAIIIKQRAKAGVVESANLIGDVKGRDAIIVDDICDTGGTLVKAAEELKKFGANKIYASITHPVFSKDAIDKIEASEFEQVFVSDSIEIKPGKYKKITQNSVANLLALIISNLDQGHSLSELFLPKTNYIDEYGVSKVQPAKIVFPDFKAEGAISIQPQTKVNVVVASANEIKINAAKEIFIRKFNVDKKDLHVKGLKSKSHVSEQPIGVYAAIKGAENRILSLKQNDQFTSKSGCYFVAIESFITEPKDNVKPTDHALVVIEDPNGVQHIYLSDGVEIAADIYKSALKNENMTVGEVLAQKYKIDNHDWFGYVTANKISRLEQILSAI